jgi:hypothetical protein
MTTLIDTLCALAMSRLTRHINRSAGQHARAIKRAFAAEQPSPTNTGERMHRAGVGTYIKTTNPNQPEA